jgi:hypothetical protein
MQGRGVIVADATHPAFTTTVKQFLAGGTNRASTRECGRVG